MQISRSRPPGHRRPLKREFSQKLTGGDRRRIIPAYINAGFIRISGDEVIQGTFINPAFWG